MSPRTCVGVLVALLTGLLAGCVVLPVKAKVAQSGDVLTPSGGIALAVLVSHDFSPETRRSLGREMVECITRGLAEAAPEVHSASPGFLDPRTTARSGRCEWHTTRFVVQVMMRLVDVQTGHVIGRTRNWAYPQVGRATELLANDNTRLKTIFVETARPLVAAGLKDLGLNLAGRKGDERHRRSPLASLARGGRGRSEKADGDVSWRLRPSTMALQSQVSVVIICRPYSRGAVSLPLPHAPLVRPPSHALHIAEAAHEAPRGVTQRELQAPLLDVRICSIA